MCYPARVILQAKWVVPISSPAIENGAVEIRGEKIVAVGCARDFRGKTRDLGDVALLPALVNAHCHLDYTDMAGKLWPSRSFVHWLDQIVSVKQTWDLEDYLRSWRHGEEMLLASGVATVADMEAVAANLALGLTSRLRVWSFVELIDIARETQTDAMLGRALLAAERPRPRGGYGLCPHALYTASPEAIRAASAICRARRWPMAIHLAESREEWEMFRRGRGAMFDRFGAVGRTTSDCDGRTPTQVLAEIGVLSRHLIVAHANYVTDEDIALLARNQVSVAHCPRCHAYFGHRTFPIEKYLARGVNVCLGTDSLASNDKLDLFAEMRQLQRAHPRLPSEQILAMATRNGARAIGLEHNCGALVKLAWADLIAVSVRSARADLYDEIVDARAPVWRMIGGKEQP